MRLRSAHDFRRDDEHSPCLVLDNLSLGNKGSRGKSLVGGQIDSPGDGPKTNRTKAQEDAAGMAAAGETDSGKGGE